MFTDAKTEACIAAIAQRVLVVDPQSASARLLADLLRQLSHCQIWTAASTAQGLAAAEQVDPYLVFIAHGDGLDGAAFARTLRRSDLACRQAPLIMICAEATAAAIVAARDAGAHEFLRRPFTLKDLGRRLEAVASRPRDWVEGVSYVGPDRRRFNSGSYSDQLRRRVDHAVTASEARVGQALLILRDALGAVESDPHQALRAMVAQTAEIRAVSGALGDDELGGHAGALGSRLADVQALALRKAEIEPLVLPLLSRLRVNDQRSAA